MERVPITAYIRAALMGLSLLVIASVGVYVAGYVLLAGEHGIYPNRAVFQLYQPAVRTQAWLTGQRVSTGFIDSLGRRRAMTLQTPGAVPARGVPLRSVPAMQPVPPLPASPASPPSVTYSSPSAGSSPSSLNSANSGRQFSRRQ